MGDRQRGRSPVRPRTSSYGGFELGERGAKRRNQYYRDEAPDHRNYEQDFAHPSSRSPSPSPPRYTDKPAISEEFVDTTQETPKRAYEAVEAALAEMQEGFSLFAFEHAKYSEHVMRCGYYGSVQSMRKFLRRLSKRSGYTVDAANTHTPSANSAEIIIYLSQAPDDRKWVPFFMAILAVLFVLFTYYAVVIDGAVFFRHFHESSQGLEAPGPDSIFKT